MRLRHDNGLVFGSRQYRAVVRDYGLQPEYITPYTPQQNGLCERFIKTFKEELCWTQRFASLEHARMKIRAWIHNNTHRRPHQALNYRTPAQQYHLHPSSPCKLVVCILQKAVQISGEHYNPLIFNVERVMGIEPTYQAWEARVLPLNYTRVEMGYDRWGVRIVKVGRSVARVIAPWDPRGHCPGLQNGHWPEGMAGWLVFWLGRDGRWRARRGWKPVATAQKTPPVSRRRLWGFRGLTTGFRRSALPRWCEGCARRWRRGRPASSDGGLQGSPCSRC